MPQVKKTKGPPRRAPAFDYERTNVQLPPEDLEYLRKMRADEGGSASYWIRVAVRDLIERHKAGKLKGRKS
jgi:Arc/MetJ-type ribon-helix-helix transcriptional regulator